MKYDMISIKILIKCDLKCYGMFKLCSDVNMCMYGKSCLWFSGYNNGTVQNI